MTIGGFRLPELSDRSRLGEESRDEGLEDRERGEMGLGWRPPGASSETKTRQFPTEYQIDQSLASCFRKGFK